jgi:hypothetical protein
MEKPFVNKKLLLQKIPGKGGWTYAVIPETYKSKNPFGWQAVMGTIDDYQVSNFKLMTIKAGGLFMPLSAKIRKAINKQAGDYVHVIFYIDNTPAQIPPELLACLKDEPQAYYNFLQYTTSEQKQFIDWIYAAKKEDTKVERIAATIAKVLKKKII